MVLLWLSVEQGLIWFFCVFEQKLRQIEDTKSSYTKEQLEKRLAKLVGGVALIKVRGPPSL